MSITPRPITGKRRATPITARTRFKELAPTAHSDAPPVPRIKLSESQIAVLYSGPRYGNAAVPR